MAFLGQFLRVLSIVSNLLDHGPSCKRARVATTDEDPRRLCDRDVVATREWQLNVLRKVFQIVDSLLYREDTQTLDREVWERVRQSKEPVLYDDRRAMLLLRDLPIDRPVRQVAGVCCRSRACTSVSAVGK